MAKEVWDIYKIFENNNRQNPTRGRQSLANELSYYFSDVYSWLYDLNWCVEALMTQIVMAKVKVQCGIYGSRGHLDKGCMYSQKGSYSEGNLAGKDEAYYIEGDFSKPPLAIDLYSNTYNL